MSLVQDLRTYKQLHLKVAMTDLLAMRDPLGERDAIQPWILQAAGARAQVLRHAANYTEEQFTAALMEANFLGDDQ